MSSLVEAIFAQFFVDDDISICATSIKSALAVVGGGRATAVAQMWPGCYLYRLLLRPSLLFKVLSATLKVFLSAFDTQIVSISITSESLQAASETSFGAGIIFYRATALSAPILAL